jgi:hypothetical protein
MERLMVRDDHGGEETFAWRALTAVFQDFLDAEISDHNIWTN